MVKLSDSIVDIFPLFTFFVVGSSKWNESFCNDYNRHVQNRTFCTLESSLGIKSIEKFLDGDLRYIEIWNKIYHNHLEWEINSNGIAFAETGKIYRKDDFEELKMDYYISILSELKQ